MQAVSELDPEIQRQIEALFERDKAKNPSSDAEPPDKDSPSPPLP
jgi:hypothetical protein